MSSRTVAVRALPIVQSLVIALALAIPASLQLGTRAAMAADPVRQDGDLFVAAASVWDGYGNTAGGVYRVRGTTAALFCASPESSFDAGFWNIPNTLIVDSRGRIVFLAPIGGGNVGLMRCDQMGAPAERLALLRIRDTIPAGWPEPFAGLHFGVRIGSLHILAQRIVTDDLTGMPRVNNEDSYEFVGQVAVPGDPNVPGTTQLFRMGADSGIWQTGHDLPDVLQSGNLVSVVAHGSDLWQSNGGTLRRTSMPYKLELTGTAGDLPYRLTYTPFGGVHEVTGAISDDTNVPNVGSGCNTNPVHDDITDAMPWRGGFAPFPADPLIYDEYGDLGLVVNTRYGPMPGPYLTHVASALLNNDPLDDMQGYFHQPFDSCRHVPWIQFSSILPWTSPGSTVAFDNVADIIASAPGGLVGTSFWGNKIMRLTPGDRASDIPTDLPMVHPQGIAAYPAHVPSMGTIVYITVHSPVEVLVTDAAGRRIGADPVTGAAVNDFGADGFDSGPGEPRVFAINDPAPGAFAVSSIGTGTGPFRIDVASADLATASSSRITTTGTAAPGVVGHHDFTLASAGALAFTRPATPPTVTPHVTGTTGVDGWYTSDVGISFDVADGGSAISASTGCGPTSIVTDTTGATIACTATSAGGTGTASVSVKRDATAPTIVATRTPAAGPGGWSTSDVAVTFACADATSGIASCASPATVTTEGRGQSVIGTATDRAGNTASGTMTGIDIDRTAPTTAVTRTPAATTAGWDRSDVTVALSATDALSGVAATEFSLDGAAWTSYAAPFTVTAEGAHTIAYRSRDVAGNTEISRDLAVNIDRTPPEAVLRFDPAVQDVVVTGTDAGSGVVAGSLRPTVTQTAKDEHAERRTYRVADGAGNLLVLVVDVRRSGRELHASVASIRYNDGAERLVGTAGYGAEWSLDTQGGLAKLDVELEIASGRLRQEASAQFSARTGQTRIEVEGDGEQRVTRAGLAIPRLTTDRGRLALAY